MKTLADAHKAFGDNLASYCMVCGQDKDHITNSFCRECFLSLRPEVRDHLVKIHRASDYEDSWEYKVAWEEAYLFLSNMPKDDMPWLETDIPF